MFSDFFDRHFIIVILVALFMLVLFILFDGQHGPGQLRDACEAEGGVFLEKVVGQAGYTKGHFCLYDKGGTLDD